MAYHRPFNSQIQLPAKEGQEQPDPFVLPDLTIGGVWGWVIRYAFRPVALHVLEQWVRPAAHALVEWIYSAPLPPKAEAHGAVGSLIDQLVDEVK